MGSLSCLHLCSIKTFFVLVGYLCEWTDTHSIPQWYRFFYSLQCLYGLLHRLDLGFMSYVNDSFLFTLFKWYFRLWRNFENLLFYFIWCCFFPKHAINCLKLAWGPYGISKTNVSCLTSKSTLFRLDLLVKITINHLLYQYK